MNYVLTFLGSAIAAAVVTAALQVLWVENTIESYKYELSLLYDQEMNRRQLYLEFSDYIENVFSEHVSKTDSVESLKLNKMFGRLVLIAPDAVYLEIKELLIDTDRPLFGKDVKPKIYYTLRKSLFGSKTTLKPSDILDHGDVKISPPQESP